MQRKIGSALNRTDANGRLAAANRRLDYTRRALGERSTLYTAECFIEHPRIVHTEHATPMLADAPTLKPRSLRFDTLVEVPHSLGHSTAL